MDELYTKHTEKYINSPKQLIIDAASLNKEIGSCTVAVVGLDPKNSKLQTAILGDSSYLILRNKADDLHKLYVVFRSKEQQHAFNFPFQIGSSGDSPVSAFENKHDIQDKDIVVVGTDGLFDNLFDENIINVIENFIKNNEFNPQVISQLIAKKAFEKSKDSQWTSPFSKNALTHNYRFNGGKEDDITVVVGKIYLN